MAEKGKKCQCQRASVCWCSVFTRIVDAAQPVMVCCNA